MSKYNFGDKVVLVTGAATGIGRATALAFGKSGATVVLADVNESEATKTAKAVLQAGGHASFIACDVSNEAEVRSLHAQIENQFGKLNYSFNNAGIEGSQGLIWEMSTENWDRVIDINLKGVWLCMKYQIPLMLKQSKAAIVNCSSIAGLVGFPAIAPYVASKHGVIGLTKTAALEYAKSGLRVNVVCPGVIKTPMIERFVHGEAQALNQLIEGEPVGRVGQPSEIADAVLWLCSDQSSFVTGHSLVVDGGWVAR